MMEDTRGRAAFRRARELASRSRRTVATIVLIQLAVPFVIAGIISFLAASVGMAFNPGRKINARLFNFLFQIAFMPINLLLGSFSAIVTALLYWKTRLAGGETLKQVFQEFEEEEMPDRNWQKRMRDRLHLTTRAQRSDGGRSRLDR
jgi:hypothetical protein